MAEDARDSTVDDVGDSTRESATTKTCDEDISTMTKRNGACWLHPVMFFSLSLSFHAIISRLKACAYNSFVRSPNFAAASLQPLLLGDRRIAHALHLASTLCLGLHELVEQLESAWVDEHDL